MVEVLGDLSAYPPVPQPDEGVTYAAKIDKAEARIDFSVGANQVQRQVRAFNPLPGAWFEFEGERIRILNVGNVEREPKQLPRFICNRSQGKFWMISLP